jgi:hypothetical protein
MTRDEEALALDFLREEDVDKLSDQTQYLIRHTWEWSPLGVYLNLSHPVWTVQGGTDQDTAPVSSTDAA